MRALPLGPRPACGPELCAFAFDPAGLERAEREALRALPRARCVPIPVGGRVSERQVRLELERAELEALKGALGEELRRAATALDAPPGPLRLMGILNVTPDSFSDGGRYLDPERALEHGARLVREGAHWIDVGGESTRPGSLPVEPTEQIRRVQPVVAELARRGTARISIDTTRASVAEVALDAGADMVNDVSGGTEDPELLPLVARRGCEVVLMHRPAPSASMQATPDYEDVVDEVARALAARVRAALAAGVALERIWLDPGIGFGKRVQHNLALLRRLPELRSLGRPLLLGVSRKSFIAHITGVERATDWHLDRPALDRQRLGGSAAAVSACVLGGAELLRVHDVAVMAEAAAVAAALAGRGEVRA